eukprot:362822-Chlamydomonas_euryale.AAC.35
MEEGEELRQASLIRKRQLSDTLVVLAGMIVVVGPTASLHAGSNMSSNADRHVTPQPTPVENLRFGVLLKIGAAGAFVTGVSGLSLEFRFDKDAGQTCTKTIRELVDTLLTVVRTHTVVDELRWKWSLQERKIQTMHMCSPAGPPAKGMKRRRRLAAHAWNIAAAVAVAMMAMASPDA